MKKLGFGCMRLPVTDSQDQAKVDVPQVCQMVDTFLDRGFTYFDTAYMYHKGESEKVVREALVKRHPRDSFTLATKLPLMALEKEGDQERIFAEQLEKCGVDYFDYYMLHNVSAAHYEVARRFDSFAFISELKKQGKVKKIGFSYHDRAQLLDEILTAHPEVDFVQLQINYLDWDDEGIQSRKCYETARKHGKPIVVMEPVKGGLLAQIPDQAKKLLQEKAPDASPASWAIRFAAGLDGVMMVLSGMSSLEQLQDNVGYMADFQPLSSEEQATVEAVVRAIRQSVAIPCTACRYCVDGCPQDIDIPTYFALYNGDRQRLAGSFPLYHGYYRNASQSHGKASDCIECGQCEGACPQHLSIIQLLKQVAQVFEG